MLKSVICQGAVLSIFLSAASACTVKGSGSQRVKADTATSGGDSNAEPAGGEAGDPQSNETCLKLQAKREMQMKLQEEGDEPAAEETAEEAAACPATEEAPADEEAPATE